jgi:hypothetical protein
LTYISVKKKSAQLIWKKTGQKYTTSRGHAHTGHKDKPTQDLKTPLQQEQRPFTMSERRRRDYYERSRHGALEHRRRRSQPPKEMPQSDTDG